MICCYLRLEIAAARPQQSNAGTICSVIESGVGCDDDVAKCFEAREEARRLSGMIVVSNVERAMVVKAYKDAVRSRYEEASWVRRASASEEARGGL